MSNETGVAVSKLPPLPATTAELTPIQKGWLAMCSERNITFDALQKEELEIQGKLKDFDKLTDFAIAKERLSEARSIAATSKQRRLFFTNKLKEKIIDKAMEFEQRNDLLIGTASATEFQLRKAAEEKIKADSAKNNEIASLKAHIENENFRIAAEYRAELQKFLLDAYADGIKKRIEGQTLVHYKSSLAGFLKQIQLSKFNIFERLLVSKEEAVEIFKGIKPYNAAADLQAAIDSVPNVFGMYEQDLKNAEAALQTIETQKQELKQETQSSIANETAVNNLQAQASGFVLTGGAVIKRKLEIVTANSMDWEMAVIGNYLTNYAPCQEFIKVKEREKLSVGQMAAALGKLATESKVSKQNWLTHYKNLILKEIEK